MNNYDLHNREYKKLKIFTITFCIGIIFIAIIIQIYDLKFGTNHYWLYCKSFLNGILAVGGSILAGCLVPIGLKFYSDREKKSIRSKFQLFFGLVDETQRPIIVLPRFKVTVTPGNNNYHGVNNITTKQLSELDEKCLAFDDIVALRHITTLFAENDWKPPRIYFDDDVWEILYGSGQHKNKNIEKQIKDAKSFIAIGLFSNCLTTTINSLPYSEQPHFFILSNLDSTLQGSRKLQIPPRSCRDIEKWIESPKKSTSLPDNETFALFSRIKLKDNRIMTIIGGQTAKGTRKLASFIRDYWLKMFLSPKYGSEKLLSGRSCAISFFVRNIDKSGELALVVPEVEEDEIFWPENDD